MQPQREVTLGVVLNVNFTRDRGHGRVNEVEIKLGVLREPGASCMQVAPPQLPPSSPRTPQAGMTPLIRRVLRTLISDFITTF